MEENISNSNAVGEKRNIFIRIMAAIFWLILTIFVVNIIIGGVIGGIAGTRVGPGKSISDAVSAGQEAGRQSAIEVYANHGGKIFLFQLGLWLVLLVLGKYPWVSKYKKSITSGQG